jgi:hypothetical protein
MSAWEGLTALLGVDAVLRSPVMDEGKRVLFESPFGVPPSRASRHALLELAKGLTVVAVGVENGHDGKALWSMELATEKYGYLAESLVANPLVQDHMLQHPAGWSRLLGFAKEAVKGPPHVHRSRRQEAVKFLDTYDHEVVRCASRITTEEAKAAAILRTEGGGKLYCEYSQDTYHRHLFVGGGK